MSPEAAQAYGIIDSVYTPVEKAVSTAAGKSGGTSATIRPETGGDGGAEPAGA